MRALDLLHRWLGGLLGLVLAVLGLSGTVLLHKEEWVALPHASDARLDDPMILGQLTRTLLAQDEDIASIVYASDRFGLVQVRDGVGGRYVTQTGETVAHWTSVWERPELWLFDLHHRLLTGDVGETVVGVAGLAAIVFVITGGVLWWPTRRTFRLRIWPTRMSGPALRWHHRDLGILAGPLLFLVALTGTMMIFRPVAAFVLAPFSAPEAIEVDLSPPRLKAGLVAPDLDWQEIVVAAHRRYPDGQIRILALPAKRGEPITIRMKRAAEWLPNGRTTLWFDPATGRLLASRDALVMQTATRVFNMAYPVHAGKVGGVAYRLLLSLEGLALVVLGSLSVWSFWFRRR